MTTTKRTLDAMDKLLADNRRLRDALETVLFGMTNDRNMVWPTTESWTKKDRDKAILDTVRAALGYDHVAAQ